MADKDILKSFTALRQKDNNILNEYRQFSEADLNKKPTQDAWNLLEITDHLLLVQSRSLGFVTKSLEEDTQKQTGVKADLSSFLLKCILKSPIRVKVPTRAVLPRENLSLEQIRSEWDSIHSEWERTLKEISAKQLYQPLFKHPIGGWYNILQTLDFLHSHTDHHLAQIERTKATLV